MQHLCQKKKKFLEIGPKLRYCDYLVTGIYNYLVTRVYDMKVTEHFNYSGLTVHGVCIHGSPSICIGRDLLVLAGNISLLV